MQTLGLETAKLGFDNRHWNYIFKALQIYKSLNGDLRVPVNFIIPSNTKDWPIELHGLKLGYRCKNIRYRGDFVKGPENAKYRVLLEKIGFEFHSNSNSTSHSHRKKTTQTYV